MLALSPRVGTASDLAIRGELICVDHDPDAVRNAIAALYAEFRRGTLSSRTPSNQLQAQLQGHSVAGKFLATCQALTSARSESRAVRLERIKQQGALFGQFF